MPHQTRVARRARALAPIACCLMALVGAAGSALGGPVNPQLVQGSFSLVEIFPGQFGLLTTNGTILTFDSFNIGATEQVAVVFTDGDGGRLLNRINGDFGATMIEGTLRSNGIVYLVNPAGVFFAEGALVNVGGIYAAAGAMSDEDFSAGIDRFTSLSGVVENRGTITYLDPELETPRTGGTAALIGRTVANYGHIDVGDGVLAMAAGNDVLIMEDMLNGHIMLTFTPSAGGNRGMGVVGVVNALTDPETTNGTLTANGGQIVLGAGDLYALAIQNDGTIDAAGSRVTLGALAGDIVNSETGSISATGAGGAVTMDTTDGVMHHGTLTGGSVDLTGGSGILLDASITGSEVALHNDVFLESNISIIGTSFVDFDGGINSSSSGEFRSLELISPDITFGGDIGTLTGGTLDRLTTIGAGTITFDSGTESTRVIALNRIGFGGDVVIGDDLLTLTSAVVLFDGRVDSALNEFNDLFVQSTRITFGDRVGAAGLDLLGTGGESNSTALGLLTSGLPGPSLGNTTTINTDLINAIDAHFMNNVVVGESLTINGVDPLDAELGSVIFNQTLDTAEFSTDVDLVINSLSTLFNASVGDLDSTSVFDSITTNGGGVTTINGSAMNALSSIEFNDDVVIGADDIFSPFQITATINGGFSVAFNGTVDSRENFSNDLVVRAQTTSFNGAVGASGLVDPENLAAGSSTALGLLQVEGPGTTRIDADTIIARDIDFDEDVLLMRDVTMVGRDRIQRGTGSVNFAGRVDSADFALSGLDIISPDTQFHGNVGDLTPVSFLGRLATDAEGETIVDTPLINVQGEVEFNDHLLIAQDTRITGGFVATFNGAIDSVDLGGGDGDDDDDDDNDPGIGDEIARHSLEVRADQTTFSGIIGRETALTALTTDLGGETRINTAEINADVMTFNDDVVLSANAILNGETATFERLLDGLVVEQDKGEDPLDRWNLTINADATFNGAVGSKVPLGELRVAGSTLVAGGLVDADFQEYRGAVQVNGDALMSGRTQLIFRDTVDGMAMLTVASEGDALFEGDVTLGTFETVIQGTLLFDHVEITATGDVIFNEAVILLDVPTVATIGSNGDLRITASNLRTGQNQKVSVVGDFIVNVGDGTVTLGDVSTLNMIDVTAAAINLLLRTAGQVENSEGTLVDDQGLDFVAGGSINFSVAPTINGVGLPQVQFATPTGEGDVSGALRPFVMHGNGGVLREDLVNAEGVILDLRAEGATTADAADSFATAFPKDAESRIVVPGAVPGPNLRQDLTRNLSLPTRVLTQGEATTLVAGRALYLDAPSPGMDDSMQSSQVVVNRLIRSKAIDALQTYEQLIQYGQPQHIRDLLTAGWTRYIEAAGENADPVGLGTFLAEQGETGAQDCLRLLGQLVTEIKTMGITSAEAQVPLDRILNTFIPEAMGENRFNRALEGIR